MNCQIYEEILGPNVDKAKTTKHYLSVVHLYLLTDVSKVVVKLFHVSTLQKPLP